MATATRKAKRPLTCSLATPPVCPCELLPEGRPGVLLIGETLYALSVNAELPERGEPKVFGYRLSKDDGTTYDLPADASSCECLGHLRWGTACKHIEAVRGLTARGLI